MSTFTAQRIEDDEASGHSRQLNLSWTVARFPNVYSKAQPRQRLRSQEAHVFNISGFDVECRLMLFPKGSQSFQSEPSFGVELKHKPRANKKIRKTPINVEVAVFDVAHDDSILNEKDWDESRRRQLGDSVEFEVMRRCAGVTSSLSQRTIDQALRSPEQSSSSPAGAATSEGSEPPLVLPRAISQEQLEGVSYNLCIEVYLTFLSHADDLSDDSDDFGLDPQQGDSNSAEEQSHDRPQALFSAVRDSMLRGVEHLMDSAQKHSTTAIAGTIATDEVREMGYEIRWNPIIERLAVEDGPQSWDSTRPGVWSVFVHSIVEILEVFLAPNPSWDEATAEWGRPSPQAVEKLFAWCPPLRQRLTELVPHETTYTLFWSRFLGVLERCASIHPEREYQQLSNALSQLAPSVSVQSVQTCMRLLTFALEGTTEDYRSVSTLKRSQIVEQLQTVQRLLKVLQDAEGGAPNASHHHHHLHSMMMSVPSTVDTELALLEKVIEMQTQWREEERAGVALHAKILEQARTICDNEHWSIATRRLLAAAGERRNNGIEEISNVVSISASLALQLKKRITAEPL